MSLRRVDDMEILEQVIIIDEVEIILDFNARFTVDDYLLFMAVAKPKYLQLISFSILLFLWGDITPTIRSHFTFQQFRDAFQKLAHQKALEALQNMNNQTLVVKAYGGRLDTVETDKCLVKFYTGHLSYHQSGKKDRYGEDSFEFDVAEKLYLDSGHSTKISFTKWYEKKEEAAILAFIEKLMEGVEVKPRFSLVQTQL